MKFQLLETIRYIIKIKMLHLPLTSTLYETSNVNKLNGRWDSSLRFAELWKHIETWIWNSNNTYIRLYCTKRKICSLSLSIFNLQTMLSKHNHCKATKRIRICFKAYAETKTPLFLEIQNVSCWQLYSTKWFTKNIPIQQYIFTSNSIYQSCAHHRKWKYSDKLARWKGKLVKLVEQFRKRKKDAYNGVEESGLADVGETNNAGSQAHAYLRGGEAAAE